MEETAQLVPPRNPGEATLCHKQPTGYVFLHITLAEIYRSLPLYSVFKIIKKKVYESVIPRLDRGIQLFERGCRWFPRSSRGMTVDSLGRVVKLTMS
ncbi:MAG: hypothetical protein HYW48_01030 [Deltaproteobacteria bacterium]|nr:hypothetical protein [Deltaproteobacteria bacterium]